IHFRPRGTIEVDGVSSGQSPTVIVDFVDLTGGQDEESRTDWPSGPVAGGAADGPGFESGADSTGFTVTSVIVLCLGVGGGSHFHELTARQGRFIFWKRASGAAKKEDRQSRARDQANNAELHARR
ncbi:MAG: hypothetical protein QOI53_402, partial [Verrucomicrobiota bacterium]|nr:hypothetical protein [Verrucomicrobiota bacterium]